MLLFHVGSSKVSAAFFVSRPSGIPRMLFSVTDDIAVSDTVDPEELLSRMLRSLAVVSEKAHAARLPAPKRIFCVLGSPWYASQTRTIRLKRNTPFVFTKKIADDLIQKEIKLFGEEHLAEYAAASGASVRTVELKNIKTLLNGYETREPLKQKTRELEMIIFISMVGETVVRKIEDLIAKYFAVSPIKFSSSAVVSFTVGRDIAPRRDSFLLVDVGGEVTEIFMVKKSVLHDSISFPLGRNFFIRGVAKKLGVAAAEAAAFISLWKDGHAEATFQKKLESAMTELRAQWLRTFQESLAMLSGDISIPGAVYLTTEGNFAPIFSDIIKTEQFSQYTLAESEFKITILDAVLLRGLKAYEGETSDSSLALDAVYINRFLITI